MLPGKVAGHAAPHEGRPPGTVFVRSKGAADGFEKGLDGVLFKLETGS
jgi:hypothetical protein